MAFDGVGFLPPGVSRALWETGTFLIQCTCGRMSFVCGERTLFRYLYNEVNNRFPSLPFSLRALEDEKQVRGRTQPPARVTPPWKPFSVGVLLTRRSLAWSEHTRLSIVDTIGGWRVGAWWDHFLVAVLVLRVPSLREKDNLCTSWLCERQVIVHHLRQLDLNLWLGRVACL